MTIQIAKTGNGQRPDPAEEVHEGGAWLEQHQADPDRAEDRRRHRRPELRLSAVAGGQEAHQAPAETEGEEHGPGDEGLRAACGEGEDEGDGQGRAGDERAEDCQNWRAGARDAGRVVHEKSSEDAGERVGS